MNRRQRRALQKQFGILKDRKNLSLEERGKLFRRTKEEAEKRAEEREETVRLQEQAKADEETSQDVASLATTLMVTEGLSYIDAMEKAKKEIQEKS